MRASIAILLCLTSPALHAQDFSALDAAAGKALFERNWVAAPASTAAADGLGPYYNARSCAACHRNGGAGAVELNAMNLVTADSSYGKLLQLRAVTGMKPEVQAELSYEHDQVVTLDETGVTLSRPVLTLGSLQHGHDAEALAASVSLRRAPGLHGLALLESVPLAQLQALADPDDANGDGISGKLGAGRFGWTAESVSLRDQVARALSLDLGLSTLQLPEGAGDCTQLQHACFDAARISTGDEFEAPAQVVDLLLAYLAALPPPAAPATKGVGANLFDATGCAACHTPELQGSGHAVRAFTDLLLHDLGPGLVSAGNAEWRTAPLWGLGSAAHFLHDGRAESLDAAVLWHGGEAESARESYRRLNPAQRSVLQAWLLGL